MTPLVDPVSPSIRHGRPGVRPAWAVVGILLLITIQLCAQRPSTRVVWRRSLNGRLATPLELVGDLAIVGLGRELLAMRASDGAVAWRTPLPRKPSAPLVSGPGWVVVGLSGGTVARFDARTGAQLWYTATVGCDVDRLAVGADRVVALGTDHVLRCSSLDRGEPLWATRLSAAPTTDPLLDTAGRLWLGGHAGRIEVYSTAGVLLFARQSGPDTLRALVPGAGRLYAVTDAPAWLALDPVSGATLRQSPLPFGIDGPPVATADRLTLLAGPRLLLEYASDGALQWSANLPASASGPPHRSASGWCVPLTDGRLWCVDPATGKPLSGLRLGAFGFGRAAETSNGSLLLATEGDGIVRIGGS